jgi:hypothetical protein
MLSSGDARVFLNHDSKVTTRSGDKAYNQDKARKHRSAKLPALREQRRPAPRPRKQTLLLEAIDEKVTGARRAPCGGAHGARGFDPRGSAGYAQRTARTPEALARGSRRADRRARRRAEGGAEAHPEQDKNWPAVEAAIREGARARRRAPRATRNGGSCDTRAPRAIATPSRPCN